MKDEMFDELVESVREGGQILRSNQLKAVASVLAQPRWSASRSQLVVDINAELERRGIPFCLFNHGGVIDVGSRPPSESGT